MTFTIPLTLVFIAFVLTLVSGITGKVPLWIAILLLCIASLVPSVIR